MRTTMSTAAAMPSKPTICGNTALAFWTPELTETATVKM